MPCGKFVSGTLTIGASVQRKLARLPIRWLTRKPGRSCGALPWTTTASLSLPRSNSPIKKEERLAIKLRTDCSLVAATVLKRFHPRLDRDASNSPALPFSRVPSPLSGQNHSWGRTRYVSELSLPARDSNPAPKRPQRQRLRPTQRFWPSDSIGQDHDAPIPRGNDAVSCAISPQDLGRNERDWG